MNINRRQFLRNASAFGASVWLPEYARAESGTVSFYNRANYIGRNTISEFERSFNLQVQQHVYANSNELLAGIYDDRTAYDVIVADNQSVEKLASDDRLQALNYQRIPNIRNIEPVFLNSVFDPGRRLSLPFLWGCIGIAYRKSAVSEVPDSWTHLLTSDEYAGRMALMNQPMAVMQIALKAMGKSLNDWSDENIAAAVAMIRAQRNRIAAFAPDNGQDLLLAGEVDIAMEYNSDMLQAMESDSDLGFVLPSEGGILWEDTLCIPRSSPSTANAHRLINYLLGDKAGADLAERVRYSTPNLAAKALMRERSSSHPAIFPSPEAIARSEVPLTPSPAITQKINNAWASIHSRGTRLP